MSVLVRPIHRWRRRPPRLAPALAPTCTRALFSLPGLPNLPSFGGGGDEKSPLAETSFHERRILPYSQKELYDVVANVDAYHMFVPYCTASRVLTSSAAPASLLVHPSAERPLTGQDRPTTTPPPTQHLRAELAVGFLAFEERYVSDVTCTPYRSVQAVAASSTPLFKKLVTTWRFDPAPTPAPALPLSPSIPPSHPPSTPRATRALDHTALSIDLVYAFASPLHAGVAAAFFRQLSAVMVAAFEARCVDVYGRR